MSGWGPLSAQSSGDQPAPWSSRRAGSAPCANSSLTVAVCPQQAAAHSGVPSVPGPLLSVSGEAPASMSRRATSASPCTDARYRGVVPSVLLLSGLAPRRRSVFVLWASPERIAPKRRRECFFCCRCVIAGEASDHGYARTTLIHSLIIAVGTVASTARPGPYLPFRPSGCPARGGEEAARVEEGAGGRAGRACPAPPSAWARGQDSRSDDNAVTVHQETRHARGFALLGVKFTVTGLSPLSTR
ncbi:hypothetical protein HNQ79_005996 [Streptomyces candidus]|uniref:Uncharacterized protein n=1 Tax=Streptomyces candidus TaxID=67283 RepID=A0A7X0LTJ1_9ACTN|nr:hypothetical protein [Streptomyces candidus]